jgi:hypothetical protein
MYIDSLWALARHRYTGSAGAWQVPGFEPAFLHKVIWTGRENNVGLTSMTQTLAYHREAKAAAQAPAQPIGRRAPSSSSTSPMTRSVRQLSLQSSDRSPHQHEPSPP